VSALVTERSKRRGPFPCPRDITGLRWLVSVAEGAGEAVIVACPDSGADRERPVGSASGNAFRVDPGTGEVVDIAAEREKKNRDRANRRAKKQLRQYVAKNRLTRMWTLTYSEITPKQQVKRDVNAFMDEWRILKGGEAFPYAYVLELHADGERWHVHVAVPKEYMDKHRLQAAWGHGLVHFDDSRRGTRRGVSEREGARRLASYLAKYMGKSLGDDRERGEHRYEVAQGFAVRRVSMRFATLDGAVRWLSGQDGGGWVLAWMSSDIDQWDGPVTWGYLSG